MSMETSYTLAVFLLAASVAVWFVPVWLRRSTGKWRIFGELSRQFYAKANVLASDSRTSPRVLEMIEKLSDQIEKPSFARGLFWRALRGWLREHSENPPEAAREFEREVKSLPDELIRVLVEAAVFAVSASATRAGFIGDMFMNMLFFDNNVKRAAGRKLMAEMVVSRTHNNHDHCPPVAA